MNSKILILMFSLLTLSSCGVKGPPKTPPETIVDSYVKEYTGAEPTPEEVERAKNSTPIPSTIDQQQINQPTTTKP